MVVSDLMLLGSDAGFVDLYFREYYLSKFFRKSFHSVKPDLLLLLGDVSAKGSELTRSKWLSVLSQLHWVLGPFQNLPSHVTLGDKDVGECSELNEKSFNWIINRFPVLDSSGCGAFEISNISFVSLNAMALLCGSNELRFGIDKVIEKESLDARVQNEGRPRQTNISGNSRDTQRRHRFGWRDNSMSSGSGPVVLLHYPLHQTVKQRSMEGGALKEPLSHLPHCLKARLIREFADTEPFELLHTVPPNATEYIFQALGPRIVFSANTQEFSEQTHSDGTREVTVPAMTWKAKDDPGFVIATFRSNTKAVTVAYCSLARESRVLMSYSSFLLLLLTMILLANKSQTRCSKPTFIK